MREDIVIIGGGLAGTEAAWQAANRGAKVTLYEMRPKEITKAHKTGDLAELVCSNSLGSVDPLNAPGILKAEMHRLNSLVIRAAEEARVPAGLALAVDREVFARAITRALEGHPNIRITREEVTEIPSDAVTIIATGPLTSEKLSKAISELTHERHLYFFDAISPIIDADSINMEVVYRASRYGKGGADYLNCPLSDKFLELAHELALQIAASAPRYLKVEDIPAEVFDHEAEIARARAKEEGKPENIHEKIVQGRLEKFKDEVVLSRQAYIRDESITVEKLILQTVAASGENVVVRRFQRWGVGREFEQLK